MKSVIRSLNVINSFGKKRILVIGDFLLDVYLKGLSTRLCPEAPVPVVDVQEKIIVPGGAANTVCNLKALGASIAFCSVIGADPEGDEGIALLRRLNISCQNIVRDPLRKTITKSRVVSGSQVITRIDQGSDGPIHEHTRRALITQIARQYPLCDGIVISDYDKGVITVDLVDELIRLQAADHKFISVDSKRPQLFSRLHPSHVKPNYDEVTKLLGLSTQVKDRIQQLIPYADILREKINADLITVTLDCEGSLIIEKDNPPEVIEAPFVSRPHVSGAGDTWLSGFILSYLSTSRKTTSARIATAAANIAIRKEDTATCSQAELKSYFNLHTKYISDLQDLTELCHAYHKAGKQIVFTNGCFDILHSGHVTYLHRARELGDVLIVGLNTDESIKRIKGNGRPINGLADRLKVLAGLSAVDHVVAFGDKTDDTPVPLIRIVRPHVFAKGGDYAEKELPETETVVSCGGKIVLLDHVPDHSTTRIINRIARVSENSRKALSELPS